MDVIYLLIPVALLLVTAAVAAFFWAVRNNQFEDMEGPAHSILFDEQPEDIPDRANNKPTEVGNPTPEQKPDE